MLQVANGCTRTGTVIKSVMQILDRAPHGQGLSNVSERGHLGAHAAGCRDDSCRKCAEDFGSRFQRHMLLGPQKAFTEAGGEEEDSDERVCQLYEDN